MLGRFAPGIRRADGPGQVTGTFGINMKKTLRKILLPVAIIWFIALFIAIFLAYFVTTSNGDIPTDGLGRSLYDTPMLMQFFLGQEQRWAGWVWFVGDWVIFWGSIALTLIIAKHLED
jgi:ABC-type arginine/histidine transport system permease subunit